LFFSVSNALTGSIPSQLGELTNAEIYFVVADGDSNNFTNCLAFQEENTCFGDDCGSGEITCAFEVDG
jgi:hypothetical protein